MHRKILTAALLMGASGVALASHCPLDAKAIDQALAKGTVPAGLAAEVKALRDKGMELHNAGQHRESERTLAEAMRKLLAAR
ncbi:hypothetical protein [Inmirania thermothiophila]|uniref:Uncharacterized protein n=1 Tax=Inmirania thermothiophila TaxID=1750597 RepID=A0A3N1Y8U8_9GAMM|nr:hypothetical protein [Inmirania thermothiophila]ROR34961.1 hypothetical protein EDC57_0874 [Inmirania thermothiophila]